MFRNKDNLIINGISENFYSHEIPIIKDFNKDHRIAMAFTILSLTSFEKYELDNIQCVDISLPNFFNYLSEVTK